jgi:folate-binding protein YgfZ
MNIRIDRERRAIHEGALVQPAPDLGALVITGSERKTWLNGMVTCELAKLEPGAGAYGLAVAKGGKILAEVWILIAADRVLVAAPKSRVDMLREHFDRHLIMEDAEVSDASDEIGWLFVHGPLAGEAVAAARASAIQGLEAATVTWTDRGGAVIAAPAAEVEAVTDAIRKALGDRAEIATPEGFERIRIEEGIPRFGVDFDDQNYPQEASLERLAVSFQKGCYLGQETVFMLEMRGHAKKRLVRLEISGGEDVPVGAAIALPEGGAAVGEITSRAPSPDGSATIALGYVKYKNALVGTSLVIEGRTATITKAPPPKE